MTLMDVLKQSVKPRRIRRNSKRVGRCVACGKPLKVHFDERNAFIGCDPEQKKHVATSKENW